MGSRFGPIVALLVIVLPISTLRAADDAISEADILGQADARIEQHRKGDAVVKVIGADGKSLPAGTKIKIEQTRHAFLFGSNIFMLGRYPRERLNQEYGKRFAELLNYATLGFYWASYEPERGRPDYERTEQTVRWCKEHNVGCKGHPLAWNWADPKWLPDDLDEVIRLQMQRITDIMSRFKDIRYWDVVNEATHHDRPDFLKRSPRLSAAITRTGVPAFVQQAFKTARKANPEAALIINDYRTDEAFIDKVISKLVDEDGRPLHDVIGIQCHQHGGAWSTKHTWEICERFAKFDKPLHFTEATIISGDVRHRQGAPWESTPEGEKRQAEEVVRFYTVLFSHPAVEGITWWDFSDAGAWQGAPAGFLRKDMTPKPAYDALKGLIKGKWWTTTEAAVDKDGQARFRGFYGDYRITVMGEKPAAGGFSLAKAGRMASTPKPGEAPAPRQPSLIEVRVK